MAAHLLGDWLALEHRTNIVPDTDAGKIGRVKYGVTYCKIIR
jgi:hypothetical protein